MRGTIFKPMALNHKRKPPKAKASKRPPRAYDSRTAKKPMVFRLFYKGNLIPNAVAYNLDERWYIWQTALDTNTVTDVNFLVQKVV